MNIPLDASDTRVSRLLAHMRSLRTELSALPPDTDLESYERRMLVFQTMDDARLQMECLFRGLNPADFVCEDSYGNRRGQFQTRLDTRLVGETLIYFESAEMLQLPQAGPHFVIYTNRPVEMRDQDILYRTPTIIRLE
jgi:hypothetical protein